MPWVSWKEQNTCDAGLAQLVEHSICNRAVVGSSPTAGSPPCDSSADAATDLGDPAEIKRTFAGFQKYLYTKQAAWFPVPQVCESCFARFHR